MTLKITIDREVEPKEITSLIYGTGGLSYTWWCSAQWKRDGKRPLLSEHDIDEAEEGDTFTFVVDNPDDGPPTVTKTVTMQQMVDAAGKAIAKGYVYERDAISENLGYCDAVEADVICQLAVFSVDEPIYG